jgi:hypothetical protein
MVYLNRNKWYLRIFTMRKSLMIALGLWVWGFLLDLPNYTGWVHHVYDEKGLTCIYNREVYSYSLFFTVLVVTIPMSVVIFSNSNIYLLVKRSRNKIAGATNLVSFQAASIRVQSTTISDLNRTASTSLNSASVAPSTSTKEVCLDPATVDGESVSIGQSTGGTTHHRMKSSTMAREVKVAKTLFIVFVVFCCCWTPWVVLVLVDVSDEGHPFLYQVAIALAHTSSSVNSILYGVTNTAFREGYHEFLHRVFRLCKF